MFTVILISIMAMVVGVMVFGAIIGGQFVRGKPRAMRIVNVWIAAIAALMMPPALEAAWGAKEFSHMTIYAISLIAFYAVLWPTAAWVTEDGYPTILRLRSLKWPALRWPQRKQSKTSKYEQVYAEALKKELAR